VRSDWAKKGCLRLAMIHAYTCAYSRVGNGQNACLPGVQLVCSSFGYLSRPGYETQKSIEKRIRSMLSPCRIKPQHDMCIQKRSRSISCLLPAKILCYACFSLPLPALYIIKSTSTARSIVSFCVTASKVIILRAVSRSTQA
jgi:hypothetical protein